MITQGDGNLDLAAVAADAALIDLLAARGEVPADDPIAGLLAAFAEEIDHGLAALLASADRAEDTDRPALDGVPAVSMAPELPVTPLRRSRGLRATTVALVVGATLSVSGVAAAVTGDPFAPYRGIVSAVTGGDDDSGAQAGKMAWLQRQLAGTRAKVAHGDLAGAEADLAKMRAHLAAADDLNPGQRTALGARITALQAALTRAQDSAKDDKVHRTPGSGSTGPAVTPVPKSTKTPEPQNTRTNQPQNTKAPEPQQTRAVRPEPTKKATRESTAAPEPASTRAPESRNTRTATPQNTKKATPRVTTSGASTDGDAEQESEADSNGPAKAERPAR